MFLCLYTGVSQTSLCSYPNLCHGLLMQCEIHVLIKQCDSSRVIETVHTASPDKFKDVINMIAQIHIIII